MERRYFAKESGKVAMIGIGTRNPPSVPGRSCERSVAIFVTVFFPWNYPPSSRDADIGVVAISWRTVPHSAFERHEIAWFLRRLAKTPGWFKVCVHFRLGTDNSL